VATLGGDASSTGSISFSLYGPEDPSCTRPPVFTSQRAVAGGGAYESAQFVPVTPGSYTWIASYSGDAANSPAGPGTCGEPAETVTVSPTLHPNPNPIPDTPGPVPRPKPPEPKRPPVTG
jgi:hypothetical protein